MAKADLGAKRRCLSCGAAFFDLNREPIACPKCAAVFQVVELPRSAPRRGPYRPMQSDARIGDDQTSSDDVLSAEADEAETDEAETDDSVPQPIEEDDKIEEIDDVI
ncbi:MAG: TIGR02300 family protein [Methylocystaceae bacterium]|nr:MAG: TIGR02300 family protein [Methylocystaceae bacterium]